MIEFIGTSLQLRSIMGAHNQWLSKTLSTTVFSSTVTDDEEELLPTELNEE
jgi:hypothetical protein